MQTPKIEKELVLLGGGHSHVAVLRAFAMKPIAGVRVTLVCRDIHTPYSGMLPGFIAGHYDYDDAHIDLAKLCQFANIRFIHADVISLDPVAKRLSFQGERPDMCFDVLSINTGSSPYLGSVPGAAEHAVPVKPISQFLARWSRLLARLESQNADKATVAVVGAGAGGVELCLAVQHRLSQLADVGDRVQFKLISRSATVLPTHPRKAQEIFHKTLGDRGVELHLGRAVVTAEADHLVLDDGEKIAFDELLWVTKASAPAWLQNTGLPLTKAGFLNVKPSLQVEGFDHIFAAGDVADVPEHPREKAGVFAVRQGKPLAANLRRVIQGQKTKPFAPQSSWLSLISTGDKYAVATRGQRVIGGKLMWRWKDRIDRQFMNLYGDLKPLKMSGEHQALAGQDTQPMRCLGCGAKVGGGILEAALAEVSARVPGVIDGVGDDAALIETHGKPLWQSIDYLPAFSHDSFEFAQVVCQHALSDLYAMGVNPTSALLLISQPSAKSKLAHADLVALLTGAAIQLKAAGVKLVGGHTVEGDLGIGLTVNGLGTAKFKKSGLTAGDKLILTKALGTGVLMAGHMQLKAKGRWVKAASKQMMMSNARAAHLAAQFDASAVTDVTGFGLARHAQEMAKASGCKIQLLPKEVRFLDGAYDLSAMGVTSSLFDANADQLLEEQQRQNSRLRLMCDPQTSGGLLIGVRADKADELVDTLKRDGHADAAIVGNVVAPETSDQIGLVDIRN